jgi:phosphinothricin acetyltransferase
MNTIIRPVSKDDAADILAIYAPYITDTVISFETKVPTLEDFSKRIEKIQNDYPYLVCEVDGKVVGYAYASKHRERAAYKYSVEVSVYVASDYHHKGIGKALYGRLFDALSEYNYYSAYAGITLPNDKSIGLHKSFGFVEVGIYHNIGYKDGKWLDVIWLEKPLKEYGIPPEKGGDDR